MLLRKRDEDIQRPSKPSQPPQLWSVAIATGALTAIAYFLGARLGLVLLTDLEGVAVFWPASGVAAGILIAFGLRAWKPPAAASPSSTGLPPTSGAAAPASVILSSAAPGLSSTWTAGRCRTKNAPWRWP